MPHTSSNALARGWFYGMAIIAVAGCASEPAATPRPLVSRPSPSPSPVRYSDVRPDDLIPPAPGDYRVHPGDVLEVHIPGLVAPGIISTRTCRVSASGMISLPLVPPIHVAGLTEAQVNEAVRYAMRDIDM
jgi:protein involved in polysaccharide export with SLBB domain